MRVRTSAVLVCLAAFALLVLWPGVARASSPGAAVFLVGGTRYLAGDRLIQMDAASFVDGGRAFVPVRYLAYALGVPEDGVEWDGAAQRVALSARGTRVELVVGSRVLTVDGRPVFMDVSPRLLPPGRVFLPARFVAEALGYEVGWDDSSRAVIIGLPGRPLQVPEAPPVLEARVLRVVDGDTAEVEVGGRREKVRLIGVDCPELSHPELGIREKPFGKEAAAYAKRRLEGRTVWLELDVSERDRYGRLLAYVWLDRPWSRSEGEVRSWMFNAELLIQGYAQVMTVPPNVRYADLFVRLAREAREARKGLWGADEKEQPASIGKRFGELEGSGRCDRKPRQKMMWTSAIGIL